MKKLWLIPVLVLLIVHSVSAPGGLTINLTYPGDGAELFFSEFLNYTVETGNRLNFSCNLTMSTLYPQYNNQSFYQEFFQTVDYPRGAGVWLNVSVGPMSDYWGEEWEGTTFSWWVNCSFPIENPTNFFDSEVREFTFILSACVPEWVCSGSGACNASNITPCLEVFDTNGCGESFNGSLSDYDENCSYVQPWSASVVNPTGGISLVVGDSFGGTIVRFYKNENLITSDMTLNAVYLNTTSVGFSGFYYEPYDSGWEWLFTVPAVSDGIYDYVVNATYVNSSNGSDTHEFLVMGYGALNITNPCVENWTCSGYGACVNLTQNCTAVIDENTCGTNYTGNYSEFPPQPCGGTAPSPSTIGLGILIFDLVLFLLISITDGVMLRKTPEANRAFRALYGLIGLIAIVAVLALLL